MSNIEKINDISTQFTRNTKVDYQKDNRKIVIDFKRWDKDNSGDFNDEEWKAYQEHIDKVSKRKAEIEKLKNSNKTASYYEKKALKFNQKLDDTAKKWCKTQEPDYFKQMLDFEEAHPEIQRIGYKDKKELPKGAKSVDISAFGMGIYDDKKGTFTGECYKNGYIEGLDKLSKAEQERYLDLLKRTSKMCNELEKINNELQKYQDEVDKNLALQDMSENGLLDKVGKKQIENEAYNQYKQIRSMNNPYYQELQKMDARYNELSLKKNKTSAENDEMAQLVNYRTQLEIASRNWSLSDMDKIEKLKLTQGFNITEASETFTYTNNDGKESYTDKHAIGVSYNDENWDVRANVSESDVYKKAQKDDHIYDINVSAGYGKNDWTVSSENSMNISNESMYFSNNISGKYKNSELNVTNNYNSSKIEMPDEEGNIQKSWNGTNSTSLKFAQTINHWTPYVSAKFTPKESNRLALGANGSYELGKGFSLQAGGQTEFNLTNGSQTLAPNASVSYNYRKGNFNTRLSMSDYYSTTVKSGIKPQQDNTFNINGNIGYRNISFGMQFMDMDSSYSHMNTYGVNASYNIPNGGTISAGYTYQHNKTKGLSPQISENNSLNVSYSLPLDQINKMFHKK